MTAPRVMGLFGDVTGCVLWRLFQPYKALRKLGHLALPFPKDDPVSVLAVPEVDAIVLARLAWKPEDRAQARLWADGCHAADKALIYEVDDDLFTTAGMDRPRLFEDRPDDVLESERQERIFALRLCDGVTVTTPRLATIVSQFTDKPIAVVPNLLDHGWFTAQVAQGQRTTPRPCIGWAGGRRPDRDLVVMAAAWTRIAARFPAAHFYVLGWCPDVLRDAVPPERLTAAAWVGLQETPGYPSKLVNIDIACCPLSEEPFNRCKTPIKSWEYVTAGAAIVASPTVYGGLGAEGRALLVCETVDDWEDALATLILQPELRAQMQQALAWRVRRFHCLDSDDHGQPMVTRWLGAWQMILEAFRVRQRRRLWVPVGARR